MAGTEEEVAASISDSEEQAEGAVAYKPPPAKSMADMVNQDAEDESLRKYKEALLGSSSTGTAAIVDFNDTRTVLVRKLALCVEGRDDMELDLTTSDLEKLKDEPMTIKEGITYKIRIDFQVQREIVTGLKYVQKTYRKGIQVDKMNHMVGSYGPQMEMYSFTTSPEEAPAGLLSRGHYTVKSVFTDDDDHVHLKWDWSFNIKKDWE